MTHDERPSPLAHTPPQTPAHLPARLSDGDITAARQRYSLVELLQRHDVTVLGSGLRRTARCPFHDDQTPSLSLYLDENRYYCFACGARGDAITLLQRLEGLDFRAAVHHLLNADDATHAEPSVSLDASSGPATSSAANMFGRVPLSGGVHLTARDPTQRDLLTVAAALYQAALAANPAARSYLRQRGIAPETAQRMHVGYAQPGALTRFISDDPVLTAQARQSGLLDAARRERLAERIIIPEFRKGRCMWLVGRVSVLDVAPANDPDNPAPTPVADQRERAQNGAQQAKRGAPKYLGVKAPKPLMGVGVIEHAAGGADGAGPRSAGHRSQAAAERRLDGVLVVEGPFDLLAAQQWHLPLLCVALVGAHASRQQLSELIRLAAGRAIWLALDADPAGDAGAERLRQALLTVRYPGAIYRLRPPLDAKDFGDLAGVAGARAAVLRAVAQVADAGMPRGALTSLADVAACLKTGVETGAHVRPDSHVASRGLEATS